MAPKIYTIDASPPCRSTYLTARALGLTVDLQQLDVLGGAHLKPDFLKINPQHTVPTLDDDGFLLWDSHAINTYLVDKYGKNDSLYPKDRKRRARVDQRLHFDSAIAFGALIKIAKPIRLGFTKNIPDDKRADAIETYDFLEAFLNGNDWVVPGEGVTVADFNLISTITSLDFLVPVDLEKYPNIKGWIERARALPYYEANQKGLDDFNALFKSLLEAN